MATRKPEYRKWRVGILVAFFLYALATTSLSAPYIAEQMSLPWLAAFCAIAAVGSPLVSVVIIAIQLGNPFSDDIWELPASDSNPVYLGNPLLVVHFGAWVFIAFGLGQVLGASWTGIPALVMGLGSMLFGGGMLLGLRLAIRLARRKLPDGNTANTD